MTGRINLVGAGEMMAAMSSQHRAILGRLSGPPKPVFLDTTAGFETNVDSIAEKAVEYYRHHLQTVLRVASYKHRNRHTPAEIGDAVAAIRESNLIFAGPGSPTYAIRQWRDSEVWDAVLAQFEAGADLLFASAASITLGRYALPVYEVYKAGEDPFWADGLDVFSRFGLNLAIVPHFNDNSGGENYDTRFCYMGAKRFDQLQELLPPDVAILGLDAYTAVCFDPATETASVSGQGGITVINGAGERRYESGESLSFAAIHGAADTGPRVVVQTFDPEHTISGYEGGDLKESVADFVEELNISREDKVELMARVNRATNGANEDAVNDGALVDLVLELREALRAAKRFDLADKARDTLVELGYEIGDTPQGATWSRR